jgi:hypothetical protein
MTQLITTLPDAPVHMALGYLSKTGDRPEDASSNVNHTHQPPRRVPAGQDGGEGDPQCIEMFIDEMMDQSFPASDPPAWGC